MDANLELALVEMLDKHLQLEEKEVVAAVKRVYKARKGLATKGNRPRYQDFVKATMPKVVADFPDMSTRDRMRTIASLWQQAKQEAAPGAV